MGAEQRKGAQLGPHDLCHQWRAPLTTASTYGLEGISTGTLDGVSIELGPGQVLYIPRGAVHSYELLDAHPGEGLVNVGCGTGRVVTELTERGIQAIGVDSSEHMISVARLRFPQGDFRLAAAEALPFEDGVLDGYRAERLYQHLNDPARALVEARRVLAPGGRIVLVDQGYDMWAIDADDEVLTRALMRAQSDAITNRWMGRRYHNLLLNAGFIEVAIEVKTGIFTDHAQVSFFLESTTNAGVAGGVVTRAQADAWLAEQARRGEVGRFFVAIPLFLASGRRP